MVLMNKHNTVETTSVSTLDATGEIEIDGRHYVTAYRLAKMLGVTARTLARWHKSRIGPPKISVGKMVLFDVTKLTECLDSHEDLYPTTLVSGEYP
jgi:hypothetical protein